MKTMNETDEFRVSTVLICLDCRPTTVEPPNTAHHSGFLLIVSFEKPSQEEGRSHGLEAQDEEMEDHRTARVS
jgi:hypothetical protein